VLGSVVAPTTLLTAVLFYFGWSFSYWFFSYFGIDFTTLGLTTQDYLLRSVDALFVPLIAFTVVVLMLRWLLPPAVALLPPSWMTAMRAVRGPLALVSGISLLAVGLLRVLGGGSLGLYFVVPPLCLAAGTVLLSYAASHFRALLRNPDQAEAHWVQTVERAAVFVLVGLSLFWAAQLYASDLGTSRAAQQAAQLPVQPDAVVYSAQSLSLRAPGVTEVACANTEAGYKYRYEGLTLMLQSGGQLVLLPRAWSPMDGSAAILIPRTDSIRLEFSRSGGPGRTC
jgi:hypothetical protein